jgi:hypothetical protein
MCSAILLLLMLPPLVAQTRPDVWKQVNPDTDGPRLQSARVSKVQQTAIARLILHCCEESFEGTQGTTLANIIQCLDFQEIPLASKQNVLLVSEEGLGCFQGGTGGGGPIWLVRLGGDVPILLTEDDFYGSLYSTQPSMTHGYHDLVLGWHMGAGETILTYFQFNGRSYVSVSRAADLCDGERCRIDPNVAQIPTYQSPRLAPNRTIPSLSAIGE